VTDVNGYPIYRRRNTGRTVLVHGIELDNRWVVPHNVYLSTKYDAHINVEVCNNIRAVKYLFKYVYKDMIVRLLRSRAKAIMPAKEMWSILMK
jgi:hypothetical protein